MRLASSQSFTRLLIGGPLVWSLLFAFFASPAKEARAASADYRFEAVQPHVAAGNGVVVSVRLVRVANGEPVKDAIIFESRMEMPMGTMAPMVAKATPLPPTPAGEYPFRVDLDMAGDWQMVLSAKAQGEKETITGAVSFMVMK